MKRFLVLSAFAAALVALLVWSTRRSGLLHPAQELAIYFTCDVHGRLVPCGCFSGQMGGLTRIATLIGKVPAESSLKVDIGNAIEGPADFQVIQHRYLLRAFQEMGYEAVNLGHAEAQLSSAQLRDLKSSSPVPLLSANLLDQVTKAPIFDGYRVIRRGPWRIALVGVMDEHLPAENLGQGLTIEAMATTLSRLLPKVQAEADFIVLLAFTDEARLHQLARDFYEPSVILGGNVSQPAQKLEHENRSIIFYTTNQSRALGSLDLTLLSRGNLAVASGESVEPSGDAKDSSAPGGFGSQVILVTDQVPEDPAIRKLAVAYREEVRHTKLEIDDPARARADLVPGVKSAAQYAGSESCLECHGKAGHVWQATNHAHAFQALLQSGADADPNCLGCHTVGFGTPSGYRRDLGASRLIDVGCESCHGAGSTHVDQRRAGTENAAHFRPLGAGDCQKCHHGEFSRPFDWATFWPAIEHGLSPPPKKTASK